jgi:peptidoglycan hydrolase-like protein with peptidoglycan-binding domain
MVIAAEQDPAATQGATDAGSLATQPWCRYYLRTKGYGVNFDVYVPAAGYANTGSNRLCVLTTGVSGVQYSGTGVLQQTLNQCEGQKFVVWDNYYGADTARGVANVQRRYGLGQDGKYGPSTHNSMLHIKVGAGGCARDPHRVSF